MDLKTTMRPIRNRRMNRRSWSPSGGSYSGGLLSHNRHTKKLFTPEIKRQLKQWLVERRENPYPTRHEKKELADATGLTYIQICNWFANWRRKLKNTGSGGEEDDDQEVGVEQRRTWKHLICTYNDHAKGNVEQLPMSGDEELSGSSSCENEDLSGETTASSLVAVDWNNNKNNSLHLNEKQTGQATVQEKGDQHTQRGRVLSLHLRKYKKSLMEKYFNEDEAEGSDSVAEEEKKKKKREGDEMVMQEEDKKEEPPQQLMKWIESTAKFTPDKFNYAAWEMDKMSRPGGGKAETAVHHRNHHHHLESNNALCHQFKELEAAEALAHLSFTCNLR